MLAVLAMPDLPPPPADLAGVSLFLDFDGTLVDLAPRPDAVEVSETLLDRLDDLADRLPGRVAIVSGRSIAQLDAMLGDHARRLTVAGSHGTERRLAGAAALEVEAPPALAEVALALETYADAEALVFERKSFGAALHYRQRPEAEADAVATAAALADEHGLTLQRGKMMVEVRAPGDKGEAVRALAAEPGAAGTRPLFFGDDVTDEDGFEAAAALGGAGVLVGPARPTAALHRLDDPAALLAWLDAAAAATEDHA
jgi:trehalose 6-phosphate phosphatase